MYATDSSVVVGAPPTDVKDGYEFIGWKIFDKGTTYYHNNTFDITNELLDGHYDPATQTGTITLVAQYSKKGEGPFETTYIRWFRNDGSECFHTDTLENPTGDVKDSTLLVNAPVEIQGALEREGHVFLGWAKVEESEDIDLEQELGADKLFLKYENGAYTSAISGKEALEVAADNDRQYQAMFAVWAKTVSVRVTAGTQTVPYTGSAQSYDYSATGAYKVEYKVGDGEWTATKPEGVTLAETKPDVTGTDVGTYTGTVEVSIESSDPTLIVDEEGGSDTATATLNITPATLIINVAGNKESKPYTGSEQSVEGYEATSDSELFDASKVALAGDVKAEAKGTNVDTYPMGLTEDSFVYNDENVTATFAVTDGELTINKRNLTLTSASDEKVYDGTPLTNDTVTIGGDGLAETDQITFVVTGSQTEVGESENIFTYTFEAAEVSGSGLAKAMSAFATVRAAEASSVIAANYNIDVKYGTLKVTAASEPDNDDDVDDNPDKKTDSEKTSSETKTGDSAKLGGALALMAGALLGLLGLVASRRRKEQE